MSDYISRQDAIDAIEASSKSTINCAVRYGVTKAKRVVENLPIAPAPIRCGECVNWIQQYFCKTVHHPTRADDTCETAFGAKRRSK